jgi:hypothetical protein
MFNNWLNEVNKKDAWCFSFVLINMDVFDKQNATKKLQVIFWDVHQTQLAIYVPSLGGSAGPSFITGCNRQLAVAHDFCFEASYWQHISRIENE